MQSGNNDSRPSSSAKLHVLFVLAPYTDLDQPGVMAGWLSWFARMDDALARTNPEYAGRLLAYDASVSGTGNPFAGRTYALDQHALRLGSTVSGNPCHDLDRLDENSTLFSQLSAQARTWVNGFEPDVIIHMSDDVWLKRAFPDAAALNIEVGWLFRAPFAQSWELDPIGRGKGRTLRDHESELLDPMTLGPQEQAFLDRIKSAAKRLASATPRARLFVNGLREKHAKVVLLPLAERLALDGRTPVFAALEPLLRTVEKESAVVLTQHPLAAALTPSEIDYLLTRFQNVYLLPKDPQINTQSATPWVDEVIADFSSVALQALLYDVEILSVADRLPFADGYFSLRNPTASMLAVRDRATRDKALYWLLTSYHLGEAHVFDGPWLTDFLRRAVANRNEPWRTFNEIEAHKPSDNISAWIAVADEEMVSHEPVSPVDLALKAQPECGGTEGGLTGKTEMEDPKLMADQKEYQKASSLLSAGDTIGAFEILQRLAESNTDCWEVYNDLAAMAVQQGEIPMAMELLNAGVAKATTPGKACFNLASIIAAQGDGEKALEVISPLLRHSPYDAEALGLVREVLGTLGKPVSAIGWARLLTDLRAPTPEVRMKLDRLENLEARCASLTEEKAALLARNEELVDELRLARRDVSVRSGGCWDDINILPDEDWLNVLIRSVQIPSYRGFPLPSFPADSLQVGTVGSSNETALREGFNFYRTVKRLCQTHGLNLSANMNLLDFGTGWGRYARTFMKDIRPEGILGVDVDPSLVGVCRQIFPYGNFETVPAFPPTELPANRFDLVVAYSVFSHLSEAAATAWIREFARILAPGGMIAITTQGRTFLEFCEGIRKSGNIDHPWHRNLARSFVDLKASEAAYDRGEFLFAPTGGGDARPSTFYGEALIPQGFVEEHWSEFLEPLEFIDDRKVLPQALIVMRKRA